MRAQQRPSSSALSLLSVAAALLLCCCLLFDQPQCTQAKPTGAAHMTRIQEVFRTLMGAKPMMLASRGKKSLVALTPSNVRELLVDEESAAATAEDGDGTAPSYWIVADERLPVLAVRMNER